MSEAPVAIGQVLAGKYRVERVLGQGGMGVVVAAAHLQLDQRVAIKFLLPDAMKSPDVVERFAREARAASKIQSEHVAKVIDVGSLESGAPYMVMEYLEGNDLAAELARSQRLPVDQAVGYVLQALEALAEAHHAGIVHRDVKPANLFLAKRADKKMIIKVLDFGISKAPVGAGAVVTHTTSVMGSPLYMSPEQLVSSKTVDARSDIWSIGIVLYEALTGSPPYQADTMPEIVALILQSSLPPPRSLRADMPAELDAVVARCLEKDPAARYANVAELARALAPFTIDGRRSFEKIARVLDVDPGEVPLSSARTQPMPSAPVRTGAATDDQAWTARPASKKRLMWVPYAAAAAVLMIGTGVAVKVSMSKGEVHDERAAATAQPVAQPTALPDLPQPVVLPAATTTASSVPSASASARPTATATPRPTSHPSSTAPPPTATATAAPVPTPTKNPMQVILK